MLFCEILRASFNFLAQILYGIIFIFGGGGAPSFRAFDREYEQLEFTKKKKRKKRNSILFILLPIVEQMEHDLLGINSILLLNA